MNTDGASNSARRDTEVRPPVGKTTAVPAGCLGLHLAAEAPQRFELAQRPHRVIFGDGLNDALRKEIATEALGPYALVTTAGMARRFESLTTQDVQASRVGTFSDAVPHVPEEVAGRATERVRSCGAAYLLAFGGGSSLDTAKAVAHRLHLPVIAVPTNFSGSEVTWNFGMTINGVKQTVLDPNVLPQIVIYDPTLLSGLPLQAAACGETDTGGTTHQSSAGRGRRCARYPREGFRRRMPR